MDIKNMTTTELIKANQEGKLTQEEKNQIWDVMGDFTNILKNYGYTGGFSVSKNYQLDKQKLTPISKEHPTLNDSSLQA